ncbi:MAG: hypothetical protein A2383_03835 [Candidatus Pacebacteria bacterium RIFOXYB1_FULL_39_46]|nr:MAG: hypothetical protein A2182_04090 [Candidatus Pacebacteria bacterium RIFOXYA1_FULL_38_18]OGJ38545.1 MAG: hypothetical protein A2383_03835 [Candidatus Pacebacteria bacterium RIFOXYB1_FULL_39_46]OGJ40405.1 MAG: hypothetical protein A2411_03975 [Candidatus Pacebacteria bacterium RIFOXYC1_FULL_39_21]OGJ40524.1 MAG: hypothetical protein A2582_02720 [Candidatus Pacebacteria bacterium RIFOXYD1_FULL_39_27]
MPKISVFIPAYLKTEAEQLIKEGHFVSLSDLIRTALRKTIDQAQQNFIFHEFKREYRRGGAIVLENPRDVEVFLETVANKGEKIKELFQPARKHIYQKRKIKF